MLAATRAMTATGPTEVVTRGMAAVGTEEEGAVVTTIGMMMMTKVVEHVRFSRRSNIYKRVTFVN